MTSTGTASAVVWPVTRSTRVSAMICPRLRVSPAAILVSASLFSAAQVATPCTSGQQPGQPGHGVRCRAQADPAVLLGVAPLLGGAFGVEPVGDRRGLGRHPPIAQRLRAAARVRGPRSRGARGTATRSPGPRSSPAIRWSARPSTRRGCRAVRWSGSGPSPGSGGPGTASSAGPARAVRGCRGRPARPAPLYAICSARCEAANAAVSRACAAAIAAFNASNCRIRSIRSASVEAGLGPASAVAIRTARPCSEHRSGCRT